MKKLIVVSLILLFGLTGCSPIQKSDKILGGNFVVKSVESQGTFDSDVYIVVDKTSGANYYWIVSGYGESLSPMFDKEGKVVIDKQ